MCIRFLFWVSATPVLKWLAFIESLYVICWPVGCQGSEKIDMMVLLDASSSIGRRNFAKVRGFISSIARKFNVGKDGLQMALATYNRKVRDLWDFNQHSTKADLLKAIENIEYTGGGTATGRAISYAAKRKFEIKKGIFLFNNQCIWYRLKN